MTTRTGHRTESRAWWWRQRMEAARTPAGKLREAQRFLHAVAKRASPAERDAAFLDAAQQLADIATRMERVAR